MQEEADKENPEVAETVAAENTEAAEPDAIDRELEIFQDLQRLQADFVNYRARVERDRGVERQLAVAETLKSFLPVLDDLDRAQAHGDLNEGPMLAIAQKLRSAGEKLGLSVFGEKGDKFDPEIHEALVRNVSAEVSEPTVADVIERGYKVGERLLRPAKVAVFVAEE